MEPIWQTLPKDLVEHICNLLDPATRRDVGFKPRKLNSLPQLDLHLNSVNYRFGFTIIPIIKGDIWTDFMFTSDFTSVYRNLRVPLGDINGLQVHRTECISAHVFPRPEKCA